MDLVIVRLMFVGVLIELLMLARVFALWESLKDRVPHVCIHIFLLLGCLGIFYLARGHSIAATVFGVVCFIWIAVCVAAAYALCESRCRLHAFFRDKNAKNFLALMGTVAVAILGIVACMRIPLWILT